MNGRSARNDGKATKLILTHVDKPWGYYENLHKDNGLLVKVIVVDPGQTLSLQSHEHRKEHWFVMRGVAEVELEGKQHTLTMGESIGIDVNARHLLANRM